MVTLRLVYRRGMNEKQTTHIVLIPGFWLGAWAWDEVIAALPTIGSDLDLTVHAITPLGAGRNGHGDMAGSVTLADRIDDIVSLVDESVSGGGRVVLVGHSGGGPVAQGVVDRRPDVIDRVIYVDSGPLLDGTSMAAMTVDPPADATTIPLPEWDAWQEAVASLEGLDDRMLAEFRRRAVAEPAAVARSVLALADPARFSIPATVICTSIPSDQLRQLISAGHLPSEIEQVDDVTYIDLPTGHWPMFSRPGDLAEVIASEVRR